MNSSAKAVLEALLFEKPKLHFWNGQWQDGGLTDEMLRALFDLSRTAVEGGGGVLLETGAGLSTLVFLAAEPSRLITIAPSADLRERVNAQITRLALNHASLDFRVARSEDVLPNLATVEEAFVDLALIDGSHGLPTVFVDFCYINKLLKQGGYLAIDDIQLYSVKQLYLLLKEQPGWKLTTELGKLVIFQKTDARRFLPEWTGQPFVVNNS